MANRGSFTKLEYDPEGRFKYVFVALFPSISGFFYMRRVVVVDGTHLTGKYQGTLLVASSMDGNNRIFPLGVAVVDSENDESWEWFFKCLKSSIGQYREPLCIISDRHSSISKAIARVFPNAHRGICYYHLQNNIVCKFKCRGALYFVKRAAYAYNIDDFNKYMDRLRESSPDIADYLEQADKTLWSRAHFPGDRFNILACNIAESLNSVLNGIKGYPVAFLLNQVLQMINIWFLERREAAEKLQTLHTEPVEVLLHIRRKIACNLEVETIDAVQHTVHAKGKIYNVDLQRRTCTCRVFNIEKIPCEHAIASAIRSNTDIVSLVDERYSTEYLRRAYAHRVWQLNPCFPVPTEVLEVKCLPPLVRVPPGKRRKSRSPEAQSTSVAGFSSDTLYDNM